MRTLLLKPCRPGPLAVGLLAAAAIAVGLAGFEHARLFHRGYEHVEIVGPLFILNAIGSAVVIMMLVLERVWLFVLGALSIVVPSLVSIYISHTVGFFGFREGGYDHTVTLIVVAELAAIALTLLGAVAAFHAVSHQLVPARTSLAARMPLAALVAAVMGAAIAGVGVGEAQAEREPPPPDAELADARQRVAVSGAQVRAGRAIFADEGCDRCHAIAAIDARGRLGPRLDTLDEDADEIVESIVEPREDTVDDYPAELMPTDYAERLAGSELRALAAFIATASGTADEADEDSGKGGEGSGRDGGSGRGRGRGDDG